MTEQEREQAQEMIDYAIQTGDLDADSDATEIRMVLVSFSTEIQEYFVSDLGR